MTERKDKTISTFIDYMRNIDSEVSRIQQEIETAYKRINRINFELGLILGALLVFLAWVFAA